MRLGGVSAGGGSGSERQQLGHDVPLNGCEDDGGWKDEF